MINITARSTNELTRLLYSDSYFYNETADINYLMALLAEEYEHTPAQAEHALKALRLNAKLEAAQ